MEIGAKIKQRRKELGWSLRELAAKMGYSNHSTVARIENGTIDIPQSKIVKFAEVLETTPSYLMGWVEDETTSVKSRILPIKMRKIPILGEIACGKPTFASQEYNSYFQTSADIKADFALIAKGDSMINARIFDGDVVFISQQDTVNNGEIAAVIIEDEATLKRVYYYPEKNKLVLQAENPAYEPLIYSGEELNTIRILGKAVAFTSLVR